MEASWGIGGERSPFGPLAKKEKYMRNEKRNETKGIGKKRREKRRKEKELEKGGPKD